MNFVSFAIIMICYILIFRTTKNIMGVRPVSIRQQSENIIAVKMFVVVLSDAACWLPIIFLGIISICGVPISPNVSIN